MLVAIATVRTLAAPAVLAMLVMARAAATAVVREWAYSVVGVVAVAAAAETGAPSG